MPAVIGFIVLVAAGGLVMFRAVRAYWECI